MAKVTVVLGGRTLTLRALAWQALEDNQAALALIDGLTRGTTGTMMPMSDPKLRDAVIQVGVASIEEDVGHDFLKQHLTMGNYVAFVLKIMEANAPKLHEDDPPGETAAAVSATST